MSATLNQLKIVLEKEEGRIPYMYQDTKGNVTVGVGYLIANESMALELNWIDKKTRILADKKTISEEFHLISTLPVSNSKATSYSDKTSIILSDEDIDRLRDQRIIEKQQQLRKYLPLETYPVEAQEVLIDMGFNLGVNGLLKKFPTFIKAVKNKDWKTASEECHVKNVSEERNRLRKGKLLKLVQE